MNGTIKKVFRTAQSELPRLKDAKDSFYFHLRRFFATVHERDFRALATMPAWPANSHCIDVGANQGQSIESILRVRPESSIVSFEANPNLARRLIVRYRNSSNVSIVAKGLSDSIGTSTLFVPSYKGFTYDGLASLDRHSAVSWINRERVYWFSQRNLTIEDVACEVNTLDTFGLAPIFVKIDVQGYEYNVLAGGRETLRRYEPILLIESLRKDPRTMQFASELEYEEYHFDGCALRKGPPSRGPNSFLMTPDRARWASSHR